MTLGLAASGTGGAVMGLQPATNAANTTKIKVASERRCILFFFRLLKPLFMPQILQWHGRVIAGSKVIIATMGRRNISQRAYYLYA